MQRAYPPEGMYAPAMPPIMPFAPPLAQVQPPFIHPQYPMQAPDRYVGRQVVETLPNDKELLGERLFPLVEQKNPKNASKITGMLLEMEVDQIQSIIRDQSQLDKWISEAVKVLTGQTQ